MKKSILVSVFMLAFILAVFLVNLVIPNVSGSNSHEDGEFGIESAQKRTCNGSSAYSDYFYIGRVQAWHPIYEYWYTTDYIACCRKYGSNVDYYEYDKDDVTYWESYGYGKNDYWYTSWLGYEYCNQSHRRIFSWPTDWPDDDVFMKVYGGGGSDTIQGSPNDDHLEGGDQNDLIDGKDGNDMLIGNAGADNLYGGNHNDTLDGKHGSCDFLVGGNGSDRCTCGDTPLGDYGDYDYDCDILIPGHDCEGYDSRCTNY